MTLDSLDRTLRLCRDVVEPCITDTEILAALTTLQIEIESDERNLRSHAGQTAIFTLVSLLARMGFQVSLAIPNPSIIQPQPPFGAGRIEERLLAMSHQLLPGASISESMNTKPDLIFTLGDTKRNDGGVPYWSLSGSAWKGAVKWQRVGEISWKGDWPVGAMASAALAAAEAFKFALRRLPTQPGQDEHLSPCRESSCDLEDVTIPSVVECGEVDFISAGAISQAALFALIRLPGVHVSGRIFDDDHTCCSNLNRNMLTTAADVGSPKVIVASDRTAPTFALAPIRARFAPQFDLADRALVGVDHIPSRWLVQRASSGWVGVGGTSHFNALSSEHAPGQPCAACIHPTDDGAADTMIPTVSFVSFWAGLSTAVRLIRIAAGLAYASRRQQLWLAPLRMDGKHSAWWGPVAPIRQCPVACIASQQLDRLPPGAGC